MGIDTRGYLLVSGILVRLLKAFADRTRDWADIEGILLRHGSNLQWKLIYSELRPLCELKESPWIEERLRALQSELG
jgi:hypothetical protein